MAVQVIKRTAVPQSVMTPERKLRTAGYARISTDSDQQELSLTNQQEYYTNLIQGNPDWEFAGLYTDDGISGTSMKKRDGLNQLLEAAGRGRSDPDQEHKQNGKEHRRSVKPRSRNEFPRCGHRV